MKSDTKSKRANDELTALVARHVTQLVSALRVQLRREVLHDIQRYFTEGSAPTAGGNGQSAAIKAAAGKAKKILPCIAPACKNPSKGPRFHYLCEKHRHAPKKHYAAWQAAQQQKARTA